MIFEYIKDKDGHRRGVICALEKNGIGWSLCNVKAGDRFNKSLALRIAAGRAMKNSVKSEKDLPYEAIPYFRKMKDRAKRYFK